MGIPVIRNMFRFFYATLLQNRATNHHLQPRQSRDDFPHDTKTAMVLLCPVFLTPLNMLHQRKSMEKPDEAFESGFWSTCERVSS